MWILGMDAGGTKAHCAIAREDGSIVAEGFGGPANYQVVGEKNTEGALKKARDEALNKAGLIGQDIKCAVFGMSGADEKADFEILIPMANSLMGEVPVKIVHDSWIGMRSVTEDMVGIVSICGTGAGHSGRNHNGEKLTLRNLDYELGNAGGGAEMVSQALHYAFRSNEETYYKTVLEKKLQGLFGVSDMDALCNQIRMRGINAEQQYQIPAIVFKAAEENDMVAQMLLKKMGHEEGLYGAGIVRRLKMEKEHFPVVLIGGLFQTGNSFLIDSYMKVITEIAPDAFSVIPKVSPVTGAIGMAIDWWKGSNTFFD